MKPFDTRHWSCIFMGHSEELGNPLEHFWPNRSRIGHFQRSKYMYIYICTIYRSWNGLEQEHILEKDKGSTFAPALAIYISNPNIPRANQPKSVICFFGSCQNGTLNHKSPNNSKFNAYDLLSRKTNLPKISPWFAPPVPGSTLR